MCGIAGIFSRKSAEYLNSEVTRMIKTMPHRGPDDHGVWLSENIAFGHLRLAIQDLSSKGKQPMQSLSGRYVIAFNGEIYNFIRLRKELTSTGLFFRGGSDTEVVLAAIEHWGLETALKKFEGMFAFSLWDKPDKTLTLCRDRLGEKPLFFGWSADDFVWSSELKGITALSNWHNEYRVQSISAYLKYGYVPTPYSIFKNIYKLIPGSYLTIDIKQAGAPAFFHPYAEQKANTAQPSCYWKLSDHLSQHGNQNISYHDAVDTLDNLLIQSTTDQMISDVPYGAFLSGGIDSSCVTSIMQHSSSSPISTFTIGFEEQDYNEALFAADISQHLGTNHEEMYISSNDCLKLVPQISSIMDEPFADSSVLPAYFVSKLAKQHVTVCLSGDGGDELFCGYNRYIMPEKIEYKLRFLPHSMRRLISNILLLIPPHLIDRTYRLINIFTSSGNSRVGLKVQKLAYLLEINDPTQIYDMLISYCRDLDNIINKKTSSSNLLSDHVLVDINYPDSNISRFMAMDTLTYLPDDNLTKVDRTSMASSLETRLPLLNHKIVEFAWSLPPEMKYNGYVTKRILRDVLYKRVPKKLIERPKMGFSVPIADWLRGSLKEWGEDYINEIDHHDEWGIFNHQNIHKLWIEHQSSKRDNSAALWNILIFENWLSTKS